MVFLLSLIKLTRTIMYVYKYSFDIYLLFMIKVRVRWCPWSVKNVITLGKLIGVLFFCPLSL